MVAPMERRRRAVQSALFAMSAPMVRQLAQVDLLSGFISLAPKKHRNDAKGHCRVQRL